MADWPIPGGAVPETVGKSNSGGTAVTASGSANTKGSWAQITSSTPRPCEGFWIAAQSDSAQAHLVDIGIGSGGSEQVIVANLMLSGALNVRRVQWVFIPIRIPEGTRIAARSQSSAASQQVLIAITLVPGGFGMPPGLQACSSYGPDTSDSRGLVVDPGGTANTKGSWAELTASSEEVSALLVHAMADDTSVAASWQAMLDIGIGAAGSEVVLIPDMNLDAQTTERANSMWALIPVRIPSGTRIAARAQSSSTVATDRNVSVAVYAFR